MGDKSSSAKIGPSKKLKFAPKIPARKIPNPIEPKSERREEDALNQELLKLFKEGVARSAPKVEKKSAPVQVAFGQGATTAFARSSGFGRGPSGSGAIHRPIPGDGDDGSASKMQKEYVEPWDYYSYYPITLPLRRPYSGNPELLDEEEFGEASADFNETQINPASKLGLTERKTGQMFLFQLPSLPLAKRSASTKGNEKADGSTTPPRRKGASEKGCSLEDLPAGFMGKMLVYKSGAVRMKLGDTLFDVTPGMDFSFTQDVVAIDTEGKHCCMLGEIHKRAILTPEIDSLVDAIAKLD
ncbi:hypothetical protein MRB53_035015 [Persea americana]|uniref:Uncharacterized protein n=1 Tax=Persea americana TaxID=3435 RepID=A0ACC2K427_PERAE|nr:hypothetical protein MRB53_035015 [Persea americana]|eukprot:TRINITY_DN5905_c0_g2_i6.p1 TRINITY_DN5905_c0_g2~~TRINITY_DN5905_c0_g2_i6.p1  ORF type:complete len:299 (-),score=84.32 TRINITY_DN5905_c0_g2_i6:224-1120(-)